MKHIPERTCVVTREKRPKNELGRFVISPETGRFALDTNGKIRSRGANLLLDLTVYDKAVAQKSFQRALKSKITPEEFDAVRKEYDLLIKKMEFRKGRKKISHRIEGKRINLD